jgi:hypothetical protein
VEQITAAQLLATVPSSLTGLEAHVTKTEELTRADRLWTVFCVLS